MHEYQTESDDRLVRETRVTITFYLEICIYIYIFLSDDVIVIAYCHRLCEVERSKRDVRMSGCKIGCIVATSFPGSSLFFP